MNPAAEMIKKLEHLATWPHEDYPRRTEDGYPSEVVYDDFAYRRIVDTYRREITKIIEAIRALPVPAEPMVARDVYEYLVSVEPECEDVLKKNGIVDVLMGWFTSYSEIQGWFENTAAFEAVPGPECQSEYVAWMLDRIEELEAELARAEQEAKEGKDA
jgi:hypothetical protein